MQTSITFFYSSQSRRQELSRWNLTYLDLVYCFFNAFFAKIVAFEN